MTEHLRKLQLDLAGAGFDPGPADGKNGPRTRAAMDKAAEAGRLAVVVAPSKAMPAPVAPVAQGKGVPAYADLERVYGPAGGPLATAGRVELPFAFVIAWDNSQRITSFACHRDVAGRLTTIFSEAAVIYGEKEFRRLRLDRFGGCFNHRAMRGSTKLSTHSWGVAVDLDPERNQLKWGRDRAAFATAAYEPFWRIVEAHGGVSLGRVRNFDWMHFQFVQA